jgi:hypothetical protein
MPQKTTFLRQNACFAMVIYADIYMQLILCLSSHDCKMLEGFASYKTTKQSLISKMVCNILSCHDVEQIKKRSQ